MTVYTVIDCHDKFKLVKQLVNVKLEICILVIESAFKPICYDSAAHLKVDITCRTDLTRRL